jgi:hypothetical protein
MCSSLRRSFTEKFSRSELEKRVMHLEQGFDGVTRPEEVVRLDVRHVVRQSQRVPLVRVALQPVLGSILRNRCGRNLRTKVSVTSL